nr:PIG-L family deacetylase [Microlunatus antarcticus]
MLAFSAHPDDETIGAGRLLSAWRRTGGHVRSVLSTSGEACFDHVGARPPGLAAERLVEWRNALAALDVEAGPAYGLPDGGLEAAEEGLEAAVARTVTDAGSLDRTVLLAPHPGDPHPDHRTVGRATGRVAARLGLPVWFFPFWMTYWSDPRTDVGGRLVTVEVDRADEDARQAAVACFPTQVAPVRPGWGAVIPPELLALHDRQLLVLPGPGQP